MRTAWIFFWQLLCLGLVVATAGDLNAEGIDSRPSFTNPVYEGADPWVVKKGNHYYLCQSEGDAGISVWKSAKITDRGIKRVVWKAPAQGWNSRHVWAPELHYLQGRWYIYYAADGGDNADHRMGVLEATTEDPQGPYRDKGELYTGDDAERKLENRWAIDGTPLVAGGRLYFVWSGWPATRDVQYLYIAPMENPWTISGKRVKLCDNDTYIWERVGEDPAQRGLNEAPQVLKRNGKILIVYSCSGSWEPAYKLGLLWMDEQADPLDANSWTKAGKPAFQGTERVHGVGHASFVRSPDGTEDWLVYHSKRFPEPGWQRAVWVQKYTWSEDGFPDFGTAVPRGEILPVPSGEAGNQSGESFCDSFDSDHWDHWGYYGHGRYIRVEEHALSLGGEPLWGRANLYRSGEKALVRGLDWADLAVQVRVRIDEGDRDAGVLLRVRYPAVGYDAHRGYFAGIVPRSQKIVLGKMDGFRWKEIALVDYPVARGRWYQLRVEAVGEHLKVFINDELKISAEDSEYVGGRVGVRVVDTRARFDDFQVTPI